MQPSPSGFVCAAILSVAAGACSGPRFDCRAIPGGHRCAIGGATPDGERGWRCVETPEYLACKRDGSTPISAPAPWACRRIREATLCIDTMPAYPLLAAADGWQCHYPDSARGVRVCEERLRGNDLWHCAGGGVRSSCFQAHPDLPGPQEWECVDMQGRVRCRQGGAPESDPPEVAAGWVCGDAAGTRVCVLANPDNPDDRLWRCRYVYEEGGRRQCQRSDSAPATCEADEACSGGEPCLLHRCVLEPQRPNCYFDQDCGCPRGVAPGSCCVGGTCRARAGGS